MDQIKVIGVFANDVSNENQEVEAAAVGESKETRPLQDFALVIATGGDGIAIW